jgi:ParB-like chromosome segregation protein Spo0J
VPRQQQDARKTREVSKPREDPHQQKATTQKWRLDRLRPHPKQSLFGDLPQAEIEALARDLDANGLRVPVEALPDGTLVTGHQRVRAARMLGWGEIDVVIRPDLAALGDAAVEAHLIGDNLTRRQLSPLGRARSIRRLAEIEAGDEPWGLVGVRLEKLKATLAARLGMCRRNVDRYLLVVQAPLVVQEAFDRKEVGLTPAGRVALQDALVQKEVATRIEAGEQASEVVAECLARAAKGGGASGPRKALTRLTRALVEAQAELGDHVQEIQGGLFCDTLETLVRGRDLIDRLIARLEVTRQESAQAVRRLMAAGGEEE